MIERRAQCEVAPSKVKYLTRDGARRGVARRRNLYDDETAATRPYLCRSCGYWHLTSQELVTFDPASVDVTEETNE